MAKHKEIHEVAAAWFLIDGEEFIGSDIDSGIDLNFLKECWFFDLGKGVVGKFRFDNIIGEMQKKEVAVEGLLVGDIGNADSLLDFF